MKPTLLFVVILSFSAAANAETAIGTGTSSTTAAAPTSGINNTAKKSSKSAGIAQIANVAASAAFFSMCNPTNVMACVMGAVEAAQALMMGKGGSNAAGVAASVQATTSKGYVPSPGTPPPGDGFDSGSPGAGFAEAQALDQKFKDAGYVVSPDGSSMSLPDGRTVSTSALAGGKVPGYEMTDEAKAMANKVAEEAMKAASGAHISAVGTVDGGGGSAQPLAANDSGAGKFDMAKYLKSLKNRDPSSVSGLSKKLGDDNIGIKSDNIFEMVSRQYKRKQSQSAFLN